MRNPPNVLKINYPNTPTIVILNPNSVSSATSVSFKLKVNFVQSLLKYNKIDIKGNIYIKINKQFNVITHILL